jgi:hypothetical protein
MRGKELQVFKKHDGNHTYRTVNMFAFKARISFEQIYNYQNKSFNFLKLQHTFCICNEYGVFLVKQSKNFKFRRSTLHY